MMVVVADTETFWNLAGLYKCIVLDQLADNNLIDKDGTKRITIL